MQGMSSRDQSNIEFGVTIKRPVEEVFGFYRDFSNLPRFLGDVVAIDPIGPATSRWTILAPLGIRTTMTIEVTNECPNRLIRYRTVALPGLRTYWDIHFAPGAVDGETEVRELMTVPLGGFGRIALALIGKFPAAEVSSNLHRLKQLLETGKVTDMSNSVAGKFGR